MSGRGLFAIATLAVVGMLVAQSTRSVRLLQANLVLAEAERTAPRALAPGGGGRQLLQLNLDRLRRAAELSPADSRILLAIGSHYLLLGNPSAAIRWYRQALELEPRPEIYLTLGEALYRAQRTEEAREAFRTAIRLDPQRRPEVPSELRQGL